MTIDLEIANCIQIETTTRCTLKCPACPRTQFQAAFNRPVPTGDIDPEILWFFFDCDSGKKVDKFDIRGGWGDAIYYPRLFELIDKFRSGKTFQIVTNGSYQKPIFWQNLIDRLDERDTIEFSIDGLEDTNALYRKNSDWPSIMAAMEIVSKSRVQLEWVTNVFDFNYRQIPEIKTLAESMGAKFTCKLTSRFGDPSLRPPEFLVDKDAEFYQGLVEKTVVIEPKCRSTRRNIISSYHLYMPCGYFCAPFVFYKSPIWKNKEHWSIKNTNMDKLLENVLKPWVQTILEAPESAHAVCKMRCKPNQPVMVLHE